MTNEILQKKALAHLTEILDSIASIALDANVDPRVRLDVAQFVADLSLGEQENGLL